MFVFAAVDLSMTSFSTILNSEMLVLLFVVMFQVSQQTWTWKVKYFNHYFSFLFLV